MIAGLWLGSSAVGSVVPFVPDEHWEELQSFDTMVASATVVGIGEGTHGTAEFQYARGPITAWLLERGFDVVLAELSLSSSWSVSEAMNRDGFPVETALGWLGWVWATTANRDAIEVLRATKAVQRGGVPFFGIDVQDPETNMDDAAHLATHLDPSLRDRVLRLSEQRPILGVLDNVDTFRAETDAVVADLDTVGTDTSFLIADLLCAAAHAYANWRLPPRDQSLARDVSMAQMVLRHVRRGHRVVVWAHNDHVRADDSRYRLDSMGKHLREALGESYRAIGTFAESGAYRASLDGKVGVFPMPPPPERSVEQAIGALVAEHAAAALVSGATLAERRPLRVRSVGARAEPIAHWEFHPSIRIAEAWDILVWFRRTAATEGIEVSNSGGDD